jgi:hypothetical protein
MIGGGYLPSATQKLGSGVGAGARGLDCDQAIGRFVMSRMTVYSTDTGLPIEVDPADLVRTATGFAIPRERLAGALPAPTSSTGAGSSASNRPSRLDDRPSRLDDRLSRLDELLARLDERSTRTAESLAGLERRVDAGAADKRLSGIRTGASSVL